MQLINKYGLGSAEADSISKKKMRSIFQGLKQTILNGKSIACKYNDNKPSLITLTSFLQKQQGLEFLFRVNIDFNKRMINVAASLFQSTGVYMLKTKDHRIMGCKYALNYKQKDPQLKVNPMTGDVMFCYSIIVSEVLKDFQGNLPQLILDVLERLVIKARETKIGLEEYCMFDKSLDQKKTYPDSPINPQIDKMAKYIQLSNRYTWMALTANNKRAENVFRKLEPQFKNSFNSKTKPSNKKYLWDVLTCRPVLDFSHVTKEQEEIIMPINRKACESNPKEDQLRVIKERVQLINHVDLPNGQGFTAMVPIGGPTVQLLFEKIRDVALLKREKNVLKRLVNFQYLPGLPIYYSFDKMQNLGEYRITNLIQYQPYLVYLEKNRQIISLTTKIDLLKQIITTMVQLRSRNVLVGKISPSAIRIQSGLITKIFDLSRGYHPENEKLKEPDQASLYLLPVSQGDQREESFSFGVLMYRTIFNITPIYMRPQQVNKFTNLPPISNRIIVALEKFDSYGPKQMSRLMGLLSLKCLDLKKVSDKEKEKDAVIKSLPYLDWILIIITMMHRYVQ